MATETIGELVPTKIPGYADAADIQAALRVYHYGSYDFDINETDSSSLVSPSIAYTINDLQNQITALDRISPSILAAKGTLISASASSTPLALAVGSNGKVLTANSGTATGLEWAAPEVTLSNSITFSNKTISGSSNTITNIGNSSLTNPSVTINNVEVQLGESIDIMPDIMMMMGC
jgi:pectate lyase